MNDINLVDQLTGLYHVGSASAWRGESLRKTGADRFLVHAKRRHRRALRPALLDTGVVFGCCALFAHVIPTKAGIQVSFHVIHHWMPDHVRHDRLVSDQLIVKMMRSFFAMSDALSALSASF